MPSQAVLVASTYDLEVLDIGLRWENHKMQEASGQKPEKQLSKDRMKAMVAAATKMTEQLNANRKK